MLVFVAGLVVLGAAAFGVYKYLANGNANAVPKELGASLTFSPFVVAANDKGYTATDYKFSSAEGNVQILSYIIHTSDGNSITVSEYIQPPQFNDIPEYKSKFLTNVARQYDTVETSNGSIYLGRLTKQNNKQIGIMLEKGLIMFMTPNKELDQAKWHSLGEQLEIQKTDN